MNKYLSEIVFGAYTQIVRIGPIELIGLIFLKRTGQSGVSRFAIASEGRVCFPKVGLPIGSQRGFSSSE